MRTLLLNIRLIIMVNRGKRGKGLRMGLLDDGKCYITNNNRKAIIFSAGECYLDVHKLLEEYGDNRKKPSARRTVETPRPLIELLEEA